MGSVEQRFLIKGTNPYGREVDVVVIALNEAAACAIAADLEWTRVKVTKVSEPRATPDSPSPHPR